MTAAGEGAPRTARRVKLAVDALLDDRTSDAIWPFPYAPEVAYGVQQWMLAEAEREDARAVARGAEPPHSRLRASALGADGTNGWGVLLPLVGGQAGLRAWFRGALLDGARLVDRHAAPLRSFLDARRLVPGAVVWLPVAHEVGPHRRGVHRSDGDPRFDLARLVDLAGLRLRRSHNPVHPDARTVQRVRLRASADGWAAYVHYGDHHRPDCSWVANPPDGPPAEREPNGPTFRSAPGEAFAAFVGRVAAEAHDRLVETRREVPWHVWTSGAGGDGPTAHVLAPTRARADAEFAALVLPGARAELGCFSAAVIAPPDAFPTLPRVQVPARGPDVHDADGLAAVAELLATLSDAPPRHDARTRFGRGERRSGVPAF